MNVQRDIIYSRVVAGQFPQSFYFRPDQEFSSNKIVHGRAFLVSLDLHASTWTRKLCHNPKKKEKKLPLFPSWPVGKLRNCEEEKRSSSNVTSRAEEKGANCTRGKEVKGGWWKPKPENDKKWKKFATAKLEPFHQLTRRLTHVEINRRQTTSRAIFLKDIAKFAKFTKEKSNAIGEGYTRGIHAL